jgi:hypothetical protein
MASDEVVHALFVPPAGAEAPEVDWICVKRFEGGGVVTAPRVYSGAELADLECLIALFGGGDYELIALAGPAHARVETGRQRVRVYGESKALGAGPPPGGGGGVAAVGGAASLAAVVGALGAVLGPVIAEMVRAGAARDAAMMAALSNSQGGGLRDLVPLLGQLGGGGGGLKLADVKQIVDMVNGGDAALGPAEKGLLGVLEGAARVMTMVETTKASGAVGGSVAAPPTGYVQVPGAPNVWVPRGTEVVVDDGQPARTPLTVVRGPAEGGPVSGG